MNGIYIESDKILSRQDIVEWLDGCGVRWCSSECKFSKFEPFNDWYVFFDSDKDFSQLPEPIDNFSHCQTPEQFCELIAESLGIHKPVFGEPIKGMAIEVSRLSEEDKAWLRENIINAKGILEEAIEHRKLICSWRSYKPIGFGDKKYLIERKCTITDSPKVFMEYVAQQTGKEYKPEPVGELRASMIHNSLDDGPSFEDIAKALGVDDDSWKLRHPSYPHKTYRILDSLDGIPLDTRFKLSEWIPPFQKDVLFIIKGKMFIGHIWKLQESIIALGGSNELIKNLDGHWMRIV